MSKHMRARATNLLPVVIVAWAGALNAAVGVRWVGVVLLVIAAILTWRVLGGHVHNRGCRSLEGGACSCAVRKVPTP